jgi:hypothetical protein
MGAIARLDVDLILACVYQVLQARIDYGQKSCSKPGSGILLGKVVNLPSTTRSMIPMSAVLWRQQKGSTGEQCV